MVYARALDGLRAQIKRAIIVPDLCRLKSHKTRERALRVRDPRQRSTTSTSYCHKIRTVCTHVYGNVHIPAVVRWSAVRKPLGELNRTEYFVRIWALWLLQELSSLIDLVFVLVDTPLPQNILNISMCYVKRRGYTYMRLAFVLGLEPQPRTRTTPQPPSTTTTAVRSTATMI